VAALTQVAVWWRIGVVR